MEKDFIAIYENVMSKEECDIAINKLEYILESNPVITRNGKFQFGNEMGRSDFSLFTNEYDSKVSSLINEKCEPFFQKYTDKFFVIKSVKGRSIQVKLQKTSKKGGYHIWHCEACTRETSNRYLVWTLYLNDIPDGEGETEFLWQGIRIKPKAGTLCIFPASFTHVHRGNPVYSCDKYIATGWVEFDE